MDSFDFVDSQCACPRLGMLALNTGLYRPAVLARDERLRKHRGGGRRIQTGAIR